MGDMGVIIGGIGGRGGKLNATVPYHNIIYYT